MRSRGLTSATIGDSAAGFNLNHVKLNLLPEVSEVLITVGGAGCGAGEDEALTGGKCQVVAAAVSSYDDSGNDSTCPTG